MRHAIARVLHRIADRISPTPPTPMEYRPSPGCELVSVELNSGRATVNLKTADTAKLAQIRLDTTGSINLKDIQTHLARHGVA